MVNPEEIRDALLERISYLTVSADASDVLALARAYDLLVGDDEDDDEDEDYDDD